MSEVKQSEVKQGARVRIYYELDKDGGAVAGVVTKVLQHPLVNAGSNPWIQVEIEDTDHPLHKMMAGPHEGKNRVITVSPDLYEVIA